MTTPTHESANTALRENYKTEGYILLPEVLDDTLMKEARAHLDWIAATYPDVNPENYQTLVLEPDPFWLRLVGDDRLLDIAQQFIGPDIALFGAHYFAKPPFEGRAVLWHQDGSYWPLEPMEVVTLWLAVDNVDAENGCLRVIPRSQHLTLQTMHASTEVESVLGSGIDPKLVDESQAVDCVLKAGGVEVHHPNLIHGSNANHSPRRRAGLAIRYIPTTSRITQTPWPAFLLRGNAAEGINDYLPRPRFTPGKHMEFRGFEDWL